MPNYGEKIVYWYLRLNGFFPLDNFVIHRSQNVKFSSDVDVIAVRFPFVYEEIGGQSDDWDKSLFDKFDPTLPIGLLCEVKTGRFDVHKLFQPHYVSYAVERFGFTKDPKNLGSIVQQKACTRERGQFQIAKILFSNKDKVEK